MTKAKDMNDPLTGSELIYGFCAWLSQRDVPTTMGRNVNNLSETAKLVQKFSEANKLGTPGKDWSRLVKYPEE